MLRGIKTNYFFFKAYSQVKKGDIDRSIEYFNRVIAADQTFSGAYLHKALALSKLKKYEEGIDEINKAISSFKESNDITEMKRIYEELWEELGYQSGLFGVKYQLYTEILGYTNDKEFGNVLYDDEDD